MYKIPAKTLFIGKNIIYVPECHSTNDVASQLNSSLIGSEGTVVITDSQLAGRGQKNNQWLSEPGKNLTFSLILVPSFLNIQDQFKLTIASSLAVYDSITHLTLSHCHIKWPNDILLHGKKVCGILLESSISGGRFLKVIVGIGLNINQQNFTLPSATSLSLVSKKQFELPEVLEFLLEKLEVRYLQVKQQQWKSLLNDYLCVLWQRDERQRFFAHGMEFGGIIRGIDPIGQLQIETDEGYRYFNTKEIEYRM